MNKTTIMALIIGLIIGVGGAVGVTAITKNNDPKQTSGTRQPTTTTNNSSMSMADMTKQLEGMSGDAYDKAFMEMMIKHHQDAIAMAQLSATRAKNQEIKALSQNIISAQEKEISQMKQWQIDWGYVTSGDSMPGMNP